MSIFMKFEILAGRQLGIFGYGLYIIPLDAGLLRKVYHKYRYLKIYISIVQIDSPPFLKKKKPFPLFKSNSIFGVEQTG